jgi:predicted HicB family RNase H-like nuclease
MKRQAQTSKAEEEPTQVLTVRIPVRWHDVLREKSFRERKAINKLVREALKEQYGLECSAS